GALEILDAVAPLAIDTGRLTKSRRQVLERLVAQHPYDHGLASRLALVYEEQGELARCEALLRPRASHLGNTEGARILGHLYATQGKYDEAYALLEPYTRSRLSQLHNAEQQFNSVIESAQRKLIEEIKSRKAPAFPYASFEQAGEQQRQEILRNYGGSRLQ